MIKKTIKNFKSLRQSDCSPLIVYIRFVLIRLLYKKNLFLHQSVKIKGLKNLKTKSLLSIGTSYVGFVHRQDKTYINISGELIIKGNYSIGRGCRIDIGKNATVRIGTGGYINCFTNLIIMHNLTIGDNCVIAWDCQLLDEDFHEISYEGKKNFTNGILIGNNVWIGCGVKIYKGTVIPDGCVIASNSIVKGKFQNKNSLIGGHPARELKQNVVWNS